MTQAAQKNVLDKYRVIAQLGRGGMADVYLAAAHGPGGFSKLLVVKVLQASLARDDEFLGMFRDEARLAARLNHPNIVQTYEVGESEGRHYIAMEYLEGQALDRVSEAIQAHGNLPLAAALRIVGDALAGLHYAHELPDFDGRPLGVVHRDITPQNIFVTYEGQVKLVDFGIAKALDSSIHTKIGTVKGKVSYMAPEQARGEVVDRTADIFSMAVVLWELLSGRRLWEGLTEVAVIGRLVQGAIPDLRAVRPDLPSGISELVMQALSPRPDKRPQTALEFQGALEAEFDRLSQRLPQRKLAELMRSLFATQRAQARAVIGKQLEKLARTTPTGITPPGGWKLATSAGAMPTLGAGQEVHEAVTTVHTGLTNSSLAVRTAPPPAAGPGMTGVTGVTGVTDATLVSQNRNFMWITMGAVGVTGLMVGLVQPWKYLGAGAEEGATSDGSESSSQQPPGEPAQRSPTVDDPPLRTGCDAPQKPLVELTGEIAEDAELTCDKNYLLRFTTYVSAGATLSIEPGTTILGDLETKGILVVQPGARIQAPGTQSHPIVFTSAAPEGQRKAGDWGGLVVLGEAPTNLKGADGKPLLGRIEGLTSGGEYGGSNPRDSSGVMSYVRVEFSGTEIAPNNEINGLTLGAVGRGTVLDHIQVRHAADDCFEFFGGNVDAKYLVCQSPGDDAFDWDYGYTGRLQFLVAQSDPKVAGGSNGFEGDNDPNGTQNQPISAPVIYNTTLCGKNRRMEAKEHYAILLRRGTDVRIRNGLFIGFGAGLDVRDEETRPNIAASTFFHNLVYNFAYPETPEAARSNKLLFDDDGGFDERAYLENAGLRIGDYDPQLGNCFDQRSPGFKPKNPLLDNAAIPPNDGFFDHDAVYVGAFRDQNDHWDEGNWLKWGN